MRKRLWAQTDEEILRQTVSDQLETCEITDLSNEESIDKLVSSIIGALDVGITASTPWSDPSPRSIPGFD
jgi:hypothetical protein